jgi:protein O-GlcNAc transferase
MTDMPWMSSTEVSLLKEYITNKNVFEYGSGSSTIWLSHHAKNVISVEHDNTWFDTVKNKISALKDCKNTRVMHIAASEPWYEDGTENEFADYIQAPLICKNELYDIFLVDGRARVDCCKFISTYYPNSLIAFHDFSNRLWDKIHNYGRVLELYEVLKEEHTLAILRKK